MNDLQKKIISELTKKTFVISDYTKTKDDYLKFISYLYENMKQGFEEKEFRHAEIKFRLYKNSPIHKVTYARFIVINKFLVAFVLAGFPERIEEEHIIDCTKINEKLISNYINEYIIPMYDEIGMRKCNAVMCDFLHGLGEISKDFSPIIGTSVSIYGFFDLANKNKRFDEIIHTKIPDGMQPADIEKYLDKLADEEMEILASDDSELQSQMVSGNVYQKKQIREVTVLGGLKPGVGNDTIAIPVNANLLVDGLSTVGDYYTEANAGRKPFILNNVVMGDTGHFSNKCRFVCSDIMLSKEDSDDCISVNLVRMEIKTKKHLQMYVGRTYFDKGIYRTVEKTDTHLIGETLYFRSPITCCHKDGICPICYGRDLHRKNQDICVGAYAAAKFNNPLNQKVLSSKHVTVTNSKLISFNETFYRFFSINTNTVVVNEFDGYEDWNLVLHKQDIQSVDEYDVSFVENYTKAFYVYNTKTHEKHKIEENSGIVLFFSPELEEIYDEFEFTNSEVSIPLDILTNTSSLFLMAVENEELTKPIHDIMAVLDVAKKQNELGITNIHNFTQTLIDLSIKAGINIRAVHIEVIMVNLIRSRENILERPNFASYVLDDEYSIFTISKALEKSPSPVIGLSNDLIARQLSHPDTYRKRSRSFIDPFFSRHM